jgi:hypothetical protein
MAKRVFAAWANPMLTPRLERRIRKNNFFMATPFYIAIQFAAGRVQTATGGSKAESGEASYGPKDIAV